MPVNETKPEHSKLKHAEPLSTNRMHDDYRGTIVPCRFCTPTKLALGEFCPHCMCRGYQAECTLCDHTGVVSEGSVWDGGASKYSSTCNSCGGSGYYPATEAQYKQQQARLAVEIEALIPESAETGHAEGVGNNEIEAGSDTRTVSAAIPVAVPVSSPALAATSISTPHRRGRQIH